MIGIEKRKALLFIILVTIITIILAASLPSMELKPGMPPPDVENNEVKVSSPSGAITETIPINRFLIILTCLIAAGFFLYSLYRVLKGSNWRDILGVLKTLLVIVILVSVVMFIVLSMPHTTSTVLVEEQLPTPAPPVTAPLGPVPPILLWIVGGCLLALGILIAIWLYRSTLGKQDESDLIMQEAEKARQSILLGVGLKDVIIQCYRQMSLVLQENRGISRKDFMTTLEFEETLASAGFPLAPIHDLTQMFNAARYGNWQPSSGDEQKAIQCFESITSFNRLPDEDR
jgi:hypothetical protein